MHMEPPDLQVKYKMSDGYQADIRWTATWRRLAVGYRADIR